MCECEPAKSITHFAAAPSFFPSPLGGSAPHRTITARPVSGLGPPRCAPGHTACRDENRSGRSRLTDRGSVPHDFQCVALRNASIAEANAETADKGQFTPQVMEMAASPEKSPQKSIGDGGSERGAGASLQVPFAAEKKYPSRGSFRDGLIQRRSRIFCRIGRQLRRALYEHRSAFAAARRAEPRRTAS
jgi:hypothetical protein